MEGLGGDGTHIIFFVKLACLFLRGRLARSRARAGAEAAAGSGHLCQCRPQRRVVDAGLKNLTSSHNPVASKVRQLPPRCDFEGADIGN